MQKATFAGWNCVDGRWPIGRSVGWGQQGLPACHSMDNRGVIHQEREGERKREVSIWGKHLSISWLRRGMQPFSDTGVICTRLINSVRKWFIQWFFILFFYGPYPQRQRPLQCPVCLWPFGLTCIASYIAVSRHKDYSYCYCYHSNCHCHLTRHHHLISIAFAI